MKQNSTSTTIRTMTTKSHVVGDADARVCRVGLRQSLQQRRTSLTVHEFSFVNQLLESATDADLKALETNLKDANLFFDPSKRNGQSSLVAPVNGDAAAAAAAAQEEELQVQSSSAEAGVVCAGGSARRKNQVERRRSCNIHAELWKRASIAVVEEQASASNISSNTRNSSFLCASINEEGEWKKQDLGSLEDEDVDDERETKEDDRSATTTPTNFFLEGEQQNKSDKPPPPARRGLLTRIASENLYHGEGFEIGAEELFDIYRTPHYDPWDEETDRSTGHAFDFRILGTSHYDQSTQPHVLSPPIMYALQSSLPLTRRGESFWLKYSLVRDGASATTFLQNLRASTHTLMAMETIDGEVFGAFTSSAWTIQPSFFRAEGGGDSFLWRMKHSRAEPASSVLEQAKRETDLEIFPNTLANPFAQVCRHDKIAVGGGTPLGPTHKVATGVTLDAKEFGFGIAFDGDSLLEATSSACMTFNSPSLSQIHSDGSKFELINLEVWALTPCITLEDARQMDYHRLFLKRHATL